MSKETDKSKMTKEEIAKYWNNYYNWIYSIYPIKDFEIPGKSGETLYFHHGYNTYFDKNKPQYLLYFLVDEDFKEFDAERVKLSLRGEEIKDKKEYKSKASIVIDKETKKFNFSVDWDYQGYGYGRAIYENYLHILEMLGIEDKEQYELQVANQSDHAFLKNMHTEELVRRTNSEPNIENAMNILKDFTVYPNTVRLSDLNSIVDYAVKSNVPNEEISKAINDNGFNISYSTINSVPYFEKEDLEQFKSFGISGLKPTCMHNQFMRYKNFGFMQLSDNIDKQDATLEFRRVFEEVKKEHEKAKTKGRDISPNLEKFGELEHIILDWNYSGLLFKSVSPDIQKLIKKEAISRFDEFDPEHKNYSLMDDTNTCITFEMLKDAGLMDKQAYIDLYQKALNRNYDLEEFDSAIAYRFVDDEVRNQARQEISQNIYCPYPKKNWQKSRSWGEKHRISKIEIPQSISKKGKVRDILKQEILKQGIARKTKIKTNMTGIGKDGRPFVVDNLKDWLFGVPGARGNLQMMGTTAVTLPPQTPKVAIDLVEKTLSDIEYPDLDER